MGFLLAWGAVAPERKRPFVRLLSQSHFQRAPRLFECNEKGKNTIQLLFSSVFSMEAFSSEEQPRAWFALDFYYTFFKEIASSLSGLQGSRMDEKNRVGKPTRGRGMAYSANGYVYHSTSKIFPVVILLSVTFPFVRPINDHWFKPHKTEVFWGCLHYA